MGTNFHTAYIDSTTLFKASSMNPSLASLDQGITYLKNIVFSCDGAITYVKATGVLTWANTIRIHFNRSDGQAILNTIAAGNITLANNEFAYVDLDETNNTALTAQKAAITTGAASNFITYNRIILAYRNATSTELYPVYMAQLWGAAGVVLHDIDDVASHGGVGGAVENDLLAFDANGLPKDSGILTADASDAVSKKHTRLHDITSTSDHNGVGGAVENNLMSFNADGLPKDSGVSSTMIYDVGGTYNGVFPVSQVVLRYPFPRSVAFPTNLTNSQGVLGIATTAQTDFDLQKNGVSFGTMRFAAAAQVATFICAAGPSFSAGDILTVVAPNPADATAADLGFSLAGTR